MVYAVKDVPGKEPQASLSREGASAFVLNTAWYGQLRGAALALAGQAAERSDGALLAACAALDRGGAGALVWAAPGSGRAGILAAALREEGVRLVAVDAVLVHGSDGVAEAELPERKLYLPATWLSAHPETERFLERSKLENMVVSHDACTVEFCPQASDCSLDRGAAACARASVDGRIMVDPYWLKAGKGHVRRTRPRLAVLLTADPAAAAAAEIPGTEAARRLAEGRLGKPGGRAVPFLDPRLPALDQARQDRLRAQHERLLAGLRCLVVNAALGTPESVARRILQALPPQ